MEFIPLRRLSYTEILDYSRCLTYYFYMLLDEDKVRPFFNYLSPDKKTILQGIIRNTYIKLCEKYPRSCYGVALEFPSKLGPNVKIKYPVEEWLPIIKHISPDKVDYSIVELY